MTATKYHRLSLVLKHNNKPSFKFSRTILKMWLSILALVSMGALASAAPAPYPGMTKRQTTYNIQACTDSDLEGKCIQIEGTYGTCTNVPANFNIAISSLAGDKNTSCFVFRNEGCMGQNYFEIARNSQVPFIPADMDDAISSVLCPDDFMD
jgi:hypothetical protein